ncbi:hypothetical protein HX109_02015 [Galbibacter sp. BG1]|uniref:hypothetical protein n=1 Tax=Galbibacter sp. BG1 TaxID=1170699 RepID=UPI0015BBC0A9|nr:hypothetical protein [Galbibacter sp. BG1]QLE00391.1 hypothetical protein HX109_02015 [Galbibacter sp. BG1]
MNTIVKYIALLIFTLTSLGINANNREDDLVRHAVEQVNSLYEENTYNDTHGKHEKNWYIYILGGTLGDLEYVKDETNRSFTSGYLSNLNELLKEVNKGNKADVYVAFTDYTSKLITPIFPSDYNTLTLQEFYINQLLENSSDKEHVVKLFRDYKKMLNSTIVRIYKESQLSNSAKGDVFMPFTNFEERTILSKETKTITQNVKLYKTYTLYHPKKSDFNRGEYKVRYLNISATLGGTDAEIKIERVVRSLNDYYYGKDIDYKECQELLAKPEYQKYLNQDRIWREVIEKNPCILYHIEELEGDYIGDTQFAQELRMVVNTMLYGAMAIPASAIVGEYLLYDVGKFLIKKYGAQKVRQVSEAAITNIVVQAVINYYFDENSYSDDNYVRMQKAIENIDEFSLAQDIFVAIYDLNMRSELILTCITGGLEFNNDKWYDASEYNFDLIACKDDVIDQVFLGAILKTGGAVVSKIYRVAKNNPKMFIKGYREILNDTGVEGLKAFKDYLDEIKDAFDINDKRLIGIKLDVEAKYAENVKQSIPDYSLANLTKDVISDIEFQRINFNSGTKNVGVNVELFFPGQNGNIRPTILTELPDGSYKMVFVVNKNVPINSIDDFINNTNITENIKKILPAFQPNTKAVLKGENAQKFFGKQNVEVNIKGVEVYTVDPEGNPVRNELEVGVKAVDYADITNFYSINRAIESKNLVQKNNLMQYAAGANLDEVSAIHRYTVNNFELTVAAYNNGYTTVQQSWINLIESGLNKMRLTKGFIGKVYRGSNLSPEHLKPFLNAWESNSKTLTIPPFQSTSKLEKVADDFINRFKAPDKSEVMFEIQSKTGVDIDEISDYGKNLCSNNSKCYFVQEEIILNKNGQYRIDNLSTITKSDGTIRYIIEMTEL